MLVGRDTLETLQHLVTFDKESALSVVIVRQNCAPHRMRVDDGSSGPRFQYCQMQQRFGGWPLLSGVQHMCFGIYFQNLIFCKPALINGTGCNGDSQRVTAENRAQIAACTQYPSSMMKIAAHCGELLTGGREDHVGQ